ncbi:F0F1 ATP synthase subunit B family protein [Maricaulis salignorans]|uniref:ATP synthase subunit b n=1 Tax=Maricaulis salignorans TaxID=144026 RepID=A0A1G9RJ44_9PROT|nr:F0F1 ATP synthase subunit B [Maricaulis salignorans]SDM23276.1 ATP synthase F0 subcomplex B subunit [Maricaulis salignorans]
MTLDWIHPNEAAFWVALSFFIVIGALIYVRVPGLVAKQLDARAQGIADEIAEARRLRDEAQELLASFQRRQQDAVEEAAAIVAQAKNEAKMLKKQAREDMAERLERRTVLAEQRIAQAEASAAADVRAAAADLAARAAEQLLTSSLKKADLNKLVDADIKQVGAQFN